MGELDRILNAMRDNLFESSPLVKVPFLEVLDLDPEASDQGVMENKCPLCHGATRITMSASKYAQWQAGTHVQDVWPDVAPGDRETLITGIHNECFDKVYGDDKEGS